MPIVIRNRYIFGWDAIAFLVAPWLGYIIRFEGFGWSGSDTATLLAFTAVSVPLKLGFLLRIGLYNRLWARTGAQDFLSILRAAVMSGIACLVIGGVLLPAFGLTASRVPISVLILDGFITLAAISLPRTLSKLLGTREASGPERLTDRPTLIVGAGAAGDVIAREILSNPQLGRRLIGFADDDPSKRFRLLCGLPVLGSLADVPNIIASHRVREMIIAMPRARGAVVRNLVRMAQAAGVHTRTVPALFEIISDRVSVSALRNVEIQDLLRRDAVKTDLAAVRRTVTGRTVLVTGAGGSIGSELCRQVARLDPARILLLGHGENSIFDIQTSMAESHPDLELVPLIADVRDARRIDRLFQRHRPDVVLHAAAHKHVPLMEGNVAEAILNNLLGTSTLVNAALAAGTERLVLISSDKAVRPCSIMGGTKRAAEMVVQQAGLANGCEYVAVRFGNVLGSRGSVVPTFLRQIRAGGPVIVTHPDMRRYFMTIPEAVQLVLQAGALGHCGEVFILDMGDPVRIADLAEDLIRLSGLQPHEDIEIRFSGLRPGERLSEELVLHGESVVATEHPKVLRATNGHLGARAREGIRDLIAAAEEHQPDTRLRAMLAELVPEATLGGGLPSPGLDVPVIPRRALGGIGAGA